MTPTQRVLVVDDEQYFRDTIHDALVADGFACEVVASAAEVPKAIEDPQVGCVLLDVGITEPHAIRLLTALLAQRPSLRVIAVSTRADQELVLEALRRGACDYLAKPIHDEELCLAVHRALAAHAVESRWESARERLSTLAVATDEVERAARGGAAREEIAGRVVAMLAEVLGAARASLLRLSPDGRLLVLEAGEGPTPASEDAREVAVEESVAGLAVHESRALLIDDVARDPRCAGRVQRPGGESGAVALAPLDSGDGVHAVLCAADRRGGGAFGEEDLALLRLLARDAARWLDPRPASAPRAPEPGAAVDDRGAGAEADLLREIADGMTREIEPARLLAASLRPVARATSARVVALYLIDNARGDLACEAQCEGTDVDRERLPRDAGLTGVALRSGAIIATDHPERDPRFDAAADTPESGAPGPLIVIPLRVRDRVLGVARVFPGASVGAAPRLGELIGAPLSAATRNVLLYRSLLESVEDVARARREAEARRGG